LLPVTNSKPDFNCFRKITLFPLNLPATRIKTVPGVMDARNFEKNYDYLSEKKIKFS
jgi:hypothetical protein